MNRFTSSRMPRRSFGALCLSAAAMTAAVSAHAADPANTSSPAPDADPHLVLPIDGGVQLDSPEFARLYGPGVFTITSLHNTVVGVSRGLERIVSNRFRAVINGTLQKVRLYWPAGTGYSKGNGGRIRITVLPDDGRDAHLPDFTAQPLATTTYVPGLASEAAASLLPEIAFESSPAPLTAGALYHVLLQNIDPNPAANFISSNNAAVVKELGQPSRWLNTTDWSTLSGSRSAGSKGAWQWKNFTSEGSGANRMSPIMQLTTTGGATQGVADIASGSVDPQRTYEASSGRPIRERFTPSTDKRVSGLSVATAATAAGTLRWRLLHDGSELASGRMSQPTANAGTYPVANYEVISFTWYDVPLATPVALTAGNAYDLELTPEGSSRWKFAAHQNGLSQGFTWPAAFTESQAQHLRDGQWQDTNFWNYSKPSRGTNWPVVLHVAS